ncbi:MAG: hypothetical protein WCS97_01290, partial [Candidatus Paceibacterota bacterium]
MDQLFEKNLISTKDAGEFSGYTSDYLARLARSGKIIGKRIGHSWFLDRDSLTLFLSRQGDRKIDYARALARARETEYRKHHSLQHSVVKTLSKPIKLPFESIVGNSLRVHAVATLTAFLVVTAGAYIAQAAAIPQFANSVESIAIEAASGFNATFGGILPSIASRINAASEEGRTHSQHVSTRVALLTKHIAPALRVPTLSLSPVAVTEYRDVPGTFSVIHHNNSASSTAMFSDMQSFVGDTLTLISSPTRIAGTLVNGYRVLGEIGYNAINTSLAAYVDLIRHAGVSTLSLAATSRDTLATMPRLITNVNLAFGNSIIAVTHTAIRADVAAAYGLSEVAPQTGRAVLAFVITTGDTLANTTGGVAVRTPATIARAIRGFSEAGPTLAGAVFDAEYVVASRFVALTDAISGRYLAFIKYTGRFAYDLKAAVRFPQQLWKSDFRKMFTAAPAAFENAYLGALGKSALALDTIARVPKVAAVLNSAPMRTLRSLGGAGLAAAAPALSAGEEVALTTYTTIHNFFTSVSGTLATLFGPPPTIVMPMIGRIAPKTNQVAVTNTNSNSQTTTYKPSTTNSYPTYTTVVRGVSEDLLNQSLASMRANILGTVAGMIQPVTTQAATNATTIRYVNMIQDLSNLIVRNGDFRGGTFDGGSVTNATSVSATSGSFTNLAVTGSATSTFAGNISVAGNINLNGALLQNDAPFIGSQWTTSGSDISYSVGNVGIGSTSPYSLLSISNNLNTTADTPLFTISSTTAGTATSTLLTVLANGNVGIGTSSPAFALDVNGIINATSIYVNGAPYIGSQWTTSSSDIYYSTGNVGVGTTSPFANFSVEGAAGGTTTLFAISTSTNAYATTTALTIDQNGNLALLNGANLAVSGGLTVNGTSTFTTAPVLASFTGLVAANNGTTYAIASSSLFGYTPLSAAIQ